ncbi:unnamed protein product [Callosobruchus maculatus]|uniref:SURP motif domain-containing protein n=1 Tax=Callosobruchus maculatus TaxID=64391 RepID=A0A653CN31_CALMS|nr:unnamed protein product [Callosobruchus maculatus]
MPPIPLEVTGNTNEEPGPINPVVGIIYPPPEVRNIVDKTASFVARNGPEFEARIRQNELGNPKFNFLNTGDPYHAYYQHKVKEFKEGKGQEQSAALNQAISKLSVTPSAQQKQQEILKQVEQPFVPKDPPAEFEFIADPPSISALDLDIVKLTAQFVARNGRAFLTQLMNREQRNFQFDFLRPQHSLFQYFTKLLEQYTKVLIPQKSMQQRLRDEAKSAKAVLEQVKYRAEWHRYQEAQKAKEEEILERERVAYAQIDWHDFVVVETVDYQQYEIGNFPPPTTPEEVGARILIQERIEDGEDIEMQLERLMGTYPGGGYIAQLGRTMKNSLINLQYLHRNHWIDNMTRCVFLEFLLYNANANLFSQVQSKFEINLSGVIYDSYDIKIASLLIVKSKESTMTVLTSMCFVLVVGVLGLKIGFKVAKKRKIVLKDAWIVVDTVIVLMSITCLFIYTGRTALVKQFLKKVEETKHNEFITYFHLFYTENTLMIMAATLVFVATFRLWKLLRFMQIIRIVEKTLLYCMKTLLCLCLCHIIIIVLFMFTGQLLKGQNTNARGVIETMAAMSLMSFGFVTDPDLVKDYKFYYALFQLYSTIYSTVVIAIISVSYEDAQLYYSDKEPEYSVPHYVRDEIRYYFEVIWIKWKRVRLTGGEDKDANVEDKLVTPKADEFRFSECLTVPMRKLKAMLHLSLLVLRNLHEHESHLTEKDESTIRKAVAYYFSENNQEKAIFYEGRTMNSKVKLVDDRVFQEMERVCNGTAEEVQDPYLPEEQKAQRIKEIAMVEKCNEKIDSIHDKLEVLLETIKNISINDDS